MRSMTGFGRGIITADAVRVAVEIRSLNHRGLEVKVHGRDLAPATEAEFNRHLRSALGRGTVVATVREEGASASGAALDREWILQTHAALDQIRVSLGLPGPVDLATVAAFLVDSRSGAAAALTWDAIRPAVEEALRALLAMRAREGAALAADLSRRLATLHELVAAIGRAAANSPAAGAKRLADRLAILLADAPVDPARLAQEIALLAEKLDISEELVRLDAHLTHFAHLLSPATPGAEPVGRKMDFLLQEIGREINTTGAKVQDATVAALVIEAKAELEKIREQAQNIE